MTDDTRLTHKPYPAGNGKVAEPKIVTLTVPTSRFVSSGATNSGL